MKIIVQFEHIITAPPKVEEVVIDDDIDKDNEKSDVIYTLLVFFRRTHKEWRILCFSSYTSW